MNAFLFPGQGSQVTGMAADLFASDPHFQGLVEAASGLVKADLRKICLRGPDRELSRTEYLQPLMVAVSLGYARKLTQECGVKPDIALGHSLGEISALAAAEVISDEQAVALAAERGRLMSEAAAQSEGGMMAVLTDNRPAALDALAELLDKGAVFLANDNAPAQFLLSGASAGLEEAQRRLASAPGVSCKRLPVAGPWHCPLMNSVAEGLARWLETLELRPPRIPILMNVSATEETDPAAIRSLLLRNLTEPARWRQSMERLKALGPETLFEIGPGRVLSGLARANGLGARVRILNINNLRGLELARRSCSVAAL